MVIKTLAQQRLGKHEITMLGLVFLISLTLSCKIGSSQTNSNVLEQYDSIEEWETEHNRITEILDSNFRIGASGFDRAFGRRMSIPRIENFFPVIILLNLKSENGTVQWNFDNHVRDYFKLRIDLLLDSLTATRTLDDDFTINLAIAVHRNYYDVPDTYMNIISFLMDGPLTRCSADCYFFSEQRTIDALNDCLNYQMEDCSRYYSKVLVEWFPFNEEYHALYKK